MLADRGEGVGNPPSPARRALRDQDALWAELLKLASAVEAALQTSTRALTEGRPDLAAEVKDQVQVIDRWEVRVEQECLRILALYDPTASDLRRMVGVLKINDELERIADLAVHVARRVKKLAKGPIAPPEPVAALARSAAAAVGDSLHALASLDAGAAHSVIANDATIDGSYRAVRKELKRALRQEPERSDAWLLLLNTVRNLERIADHAAHVARQVIYIKEGRIVYHSETSSTP